MNPRIVKIGRNILFMLSVPVIISAFVFADVTTKNEVCSGVHVSFANNQVSFVTKENINTIIQEKGIVADKTELRKININELEKSIEANKWVKNSDIFVSANNIIYIKIEQKVPVVRIQPENGHEEPYYLDEYGNTIRYSEQYVPDLPVVTLSEIGYSTADLKLKSDIVKLSAYLSKDTFWNAAVTQISVDENKRITLIPALGNQHIILGDVTNLDYKMNKLFQFYKQGYHTVNWDKYDEIDLRFDRQVLCRNTRGERISVDPYDKTTHKEIQAIAKVNDMKQDAPIAIAGITKPAAPAKKSLQEKPKQDPVAKEVKKAAPEKVIAKNAAPKPEKAVAKNDPSPEKAGMKKAVKAPADKKEIKVTEVQNSKYFK